MSSSPTAAKSNWHPDELSPVARRRFAISGGLIKNHAPIGRVGSEGVLGRQRRKCLQTVSACRTGMTRARRSEKGPTAVFKPGRSAWTQSQRGAAGVVAITNPCSTSAPIPTTCRSRSNDFVTPDRHGAQSADGWVDHVDRGNDIGRACPWLHARTALGDETTAFTGRRIN
jgi:hypothetical protein